MRKPILTYHKGNPVYMLDAKLIYDGKKTMRVRFMDRTYFWPKAHVEMITPSRFAVKPEFFDIMFDQDMFKRTTLVKSVFHSLWNKIKRN